MRSQGGGGREGAGGLNLGSLSALEARGARATSVSSTTVAVAVGSMLTIQRFIGMDRQELVRLYVD